MAVSDYYRDVSSSPKPGCFDDVGESSGSPVATPLSSEDHYDKTARFHPVKRARTGGSGPAYGGLKPRKTLMEMSGKTFRRNMAGDSSHSSNPSNSPSSDGAFSVSSLGHDSDHHMVTTESPASEWPDWDFKLPSLPSLLL